MHCIDAIQRQALTPSRVELVHFECSLHALARLRRTDASSLLAGGAGGVVRVEGDLPLD